ncbi:hypothetical protein IQ13_3098 [Lacibacter cauensis]|uniref:Uncharacterized protein n=1 Tax=Lacibacter cauensis TaxID=510947 RepID=A0A562SGJ8_9BACT|nr:hypothetical protein IQ13_3098 [Lacibacter cauensis]
MRLRINPFTPGSDKIDFNHLLYFKKQMITLISNKQFADSGSGKTEYRRRLRHA